MTRAGEFKTSIAASLTGASVACSARVPPVSRRPNALRFSRDRCLIRKSGKSEAIGYAGMYQFY